MKYMLLRSVSFATCLFLLPFGGLFAQRVPVWEVCDSAHIQYLYTDGRILSAASPSDIATIGEATGGNRFDRVVRRTTDSGVTWQELFSQRVGWDHWRSIAHPTPSCYIIYGDTDNYLGQDKNGNFWNKYRAYFLISQDTGASWSRTYLDSNTRIEDVVMRTATTGAAILTHMGNVYDSLPDTLPADLLVTRDGWKSWTTAPLPAGVHYCPQLFWFRDGVLGTYAYSPLDTDGYRYNYRYYKSTDGGLSWTKLGLLPWGGEVTFLNENVGWAATTDWRAYPQYKGLIVQTTDGGANWHTHFDDSLNAMSYGGLESIAFSDSLHGIAAGRAILQTEDGGATWIQSDPPFQAPANGPYGVSSVLMLSPTFAIADFGSTIIRNLGRTTLRAPFFHAHDPGPIPIAPTNIAWTPVRGAKRYELRLATDPPWPGSADKLFYQPVLDTIVDDTIVSLTSPVPAVAYDGWLRAIAGSDTSSWRQSGEWFQIEDLFRTVSKPGLPLPPVILSPVNGTHVNANPRVTWSAVPGATGYELAFAQEGLFYNSQTLTDTTIVLQDLQSSLYYYIKVKAYLPNDSTDWSTETYFAVDAQGIVSLSASQQDQVMLYPNPARDLVHVNIENSSGLTATIQDELGRWAQISAVPDGSGLSLDVRSLVPGIYELVVSGKEQRRFRMVIMR